MNSELLNLSLFAHSIAKVLLMTGLGPALILWACSGARVPHHGVCQFEDKFSGRAVSRRGKSVQRNAATSPSREHWRARMMYEFMAAILLSGVLLVLWSLSDCLKALTRWIDKKTERLY